VSHDPAHIIELEAYRKNLERKGWTIVCVHGVWVLSKGDKRASFARPDSWDALAQGLTWAGLEQELCSHRADTASLFDHQRDMRPQEAAE
jgi:hypothetical protein